MTSGVDRCAVCKSRLGSYHEDYHCHRIQAHRTANETGRPQTLWEMNGVSAGFTEREGRDGYFDFVASRTHREVDTVHPLPKGWAVNLPHKHTVWIVRHHGSEVATELREDLAYDRAHVMAEEL